ncbi:DUF6286 domain-containing protein [Microlunatus flavus]|uniref:DUF6286 domain-containing protein n=1 Tax=Microlunatus flavus TaxID=1036181 RepID=A0A1H9F084_9ACTN|nr:DUF6286 domain-containing protein [Microlunatus flavus]SEQ31390.1 hypothetical protein SAMN05421756_103109 [Microlunatus flavus]
MSTTRSRRLRRRPSRTVPATIVAVLLLGLGALTAVVAISRLATGTWPTQATAPASAVAGQTWGSPAVVVAAALAVVAGVVLLLAGLKPGGHRSTQLRGPSGELVGQTDYVITNGAVARLAAAQADRVDGVDKVSASSDGRRVRLHLTTSSEQTAQIRDRVVQRVTDTLTAAGLDPAPRVSATVTTKDL